MAPKVQNKRDSWFNSKPSAPMALKLTTTGPRQREPLATASAPAIGPRASVCRALTGR